MAFPSQKNNASTQRTQRIRKGGITARSANQSSARSDPKIHWALAPRQLFLCDPRVSIASSAVKRFLLTVALLPGKPKMNLPHPPLLVISDRLQARRSLVEIAEATFRGGCRWFSLREKDLPAAERADMLRTLVALGHRFGATVTAHEDLAAVVAVGADGVHLPGGGDTGAARHQLPSGLIGVSAHAPEEAAAQLAAGADYVTLSPIFLSASKPGYGPAVGLHTIAAAVRLSPGPFIALGGIDADNAASCLAAGARGIAVMGEVMRATDPEATVRNLLAAIAVK
jgi:thiamine-phosphate pyrophosphorylase